MSKDDEKNFLLNIQLIVKFVFLIGILLSLILSYDKKLKLDKKTGLFSETEAQNLLLFQTFISIAVSVAFLYINYKEYEITKKEDSANRSDALLQIQSSYLFVIGSIISKYIVIKNYSNKNLTISELQSF